MSGGIEQHRKDCVNLKAFIDFLLAYSNENDSIVYTDCHLDQVIQRAFNPISLIKRIASRLFSHMFWPWGSVPHVCGIFSCKKKRPRRNLQVKGRLFEL